MENIDYLINQAKMLVHRLERISPDSIWARRSSGHRGALIRWVEQVENQSNSADAEWTTRKSDLQRLASLIEASYQFLEKAVQEYYK
jgi:hypothetical protein